MVQAPLVMQHNLHFPLERIRALTAYIKTIEAALRIAEMACNKVGAMSGKHTSGFRNGALSKLKIFDGVGNRCLILERMQRRGMP